MDDSNSDPAKSPDAAQGNPLLDVEGGDRLELFLSLARAKEEDPTARDYMSPLIPSLTLFSVTPASSSSPASLPSVTFLFTPQQAHLNGLGNLHGGAAATLFDYCTTCALALASRPGFWSLFGVSRTLSVTYLRPVARGEEVLIVCEVLALGRRTAALRGSMVRRRDGVLLAVAEHGKVNNDPEPDGAKL